MCLALAAAIRSLPVAARCTDRTDTTCRRPARTPPVETSAIARLAERAAAAFRRAITAFRRAILVKTALTLAAAELDVDTLTTRLDDADKFAAILVAARA